MAIFKKGPAHPHPGRDIEMWMSGQPMPTLQFCGVWGTKSTDPVFLVSPPSPATGDPTQSSSATDRPLYERLVGPAPARAGSERIRIHRWFRNTQVLAPICGSVFVYDIWRRGRGFP